jgi:pilus assembly protein CpaE
MLTMTSALAVVEEDPGMRAALAAEFGRVVNVVASASTDELIDDADIAPTALVVFGPSFANGEGLSRLASFTTLRPAATVILAVEVWAPELAQQAVSAGVSEVITLDQVVELVDQAAPPEPTDPGPSEEGGRVVTVMSPKGGAGKSVIATNLAVALAQQSDRPVCLLDCDLQFGDTAVMLMLTVNYTIADAARSVDRLDLTQLQGLLTEHKTSKLLVLPAPTEPVVADQITTDEVLKVVALLRQLCSYVVIDTASHFNDMLISLLDESDDIILVTSLDLPSVKNSKLGLQTLRLLGIPVDKIRLVLNRVNSAVPLNAERVEHVLDIPAQGLIPSDIAVVQSVNKGQPVVALAPKSAAAKALFRLAGVLTEPRSTLSGRR